MSRSRTISGRRDRIASSLVALVLVGRVRRSAVLRSEEEGVAVAVDGARTEVRRTNSTL